MTLLKAKRINETMPRKEHCLAVCLCSYERDIYLRRAAVFFFAVFFAAFLTVFFAAFLAFFFVAILKVKLFLLLTSTALSSSQRAV